MVQRIRRLLGIKKVGHAATLDPFASGLLLICAGRPATRHIETFMSGQKTYQATIQLGRETTTLDPEGEVTAVRAVPAMSEQEIKALLIEFIGPRMQVPPAYSAVKHKGKPLYHYARKGITVEKEAKPIEIYAAALDKYDPDTAQLTFTVSCSRGTYIRVLAAEIGQQLNCGGHLIQLRRTQSGGFAVDQAIDGNRLFSDEQGLTALMESMLTVEQALAC